MIPLPTTKGVRKVGQKLYFEYHCLESHESQDAELWYRSHQLVTVIEFAPNDGWGIESYEERCKVGCPIVYAIRFNDGFVGDVFEDELLDNKKEFFRPDPPKKRIK